MALSGEIHIMLNFEDVQERDGQSMLFDDDVNLLNVRYRCSFILGSISSHMIQSLANCLVGYSKSLLVREQTHFYHEF